jgi:hypothetical protein
VADNQTVSLQIGQMLPDRIGGHTEVSGDGFRAAVALAAEELQDFHARRSAGNHEAHIRLFGMLAQPKTIYYRSTLTKDSRFVHWCPGD